MTAPVTESPPLPDATPLNARAARGRREDFEELVRRHLPLVEGTVRRVPGEGCADPVQTVFAICPAGTPAHRNAQLRHEGASDPLYAALCGPLERRTPGSQE